MNGRLFDALALAYEGLWYAAAPFLYMNRRLRQGFRERLFLDPPVGFHDVWLQAASAGEANLAQELLPALARSGREAGAPLTVFATTCTRQGMEALEKARAAALEQDPEATVSLAYLPFDMPSLMRRVLDAVSPKVVVLLETELWPGMLAACREFGIPAVVVNGRLTTRSLAGYLLARGVLSRIGPERILAISEDARRRYALLFGRERVGRMENIKFDRLPAAAAGGDDEALPLAPLLGDRPALALFGSVRREEEDAVLAALRQIREARPKTPLAVVPRHMERLDFWRKALYAAGLDPVLRSQLSGPPAPDATILWDTFGELASAYAHARAAFVGGSLAPLGGQNFLEAISCGLTPIIGPHWKNFAWVGREVVEQGLVVEVADADGLAQAMLRLLAKPKPRDAVRKRFAAWVDPHRGGAAQAAELVRRYL
ncbi:MAG: glycosyltransferase N-terminal domain-containing protein [Thermodesulfobacteriota bacterium]